VLEDLHHAEVHVDRTFLTVLATEAARLPGILSMHDKPKGYTRRKLPAKSNKAK
jgi:hypothetical protein